MSKFKLDTTEEKVEEVLEETVEETVVEEVEKVVGKEIDAKAKIKEGELQSHSEYDPS